VRPGRHLEIRTRKKARACAGLPFGAIKVASAGIFRLPKKNIIAAGRLDVGRAINVPSIPLGLLVKNQTLERD
jgi:hypothetical protein